MEKDELREAILRRLPDAYTEHYEAWRRFNRLYVAASAGGVIAILGAIGTRLGDPEQAVVDPRLFFSLCFFLFSLLLAWIAAGGEVRGTKAHFNELSDLTGGDLADHRRRRRLEMLVYAGREPHLLERIAAGGSPTLTVFGILNGLGYLYERLMW